MNVAMEITSEDALIARFIVRPVFIDQIRAGQDSDEFLASKRKMVSEDQGGEFSIRDDSMLMFGT